MTYGTEAPGRSNVVETSPEASGDGPLGEAEGGSEALPFRFTGYGNDYFGVWITNTLLRIVTFGIYSPWAKVRRRRYFYTRTSLDGFVFDYPADPLKILRGWGIAAAFFIAYSVAVRMSPVAGSVAAGLIFLAFPWIVVRSLVFNTRNSTYRGLRFGFRRNYRDAYRIYLGLALLIVPTIGLIVPYLTYRQKKFLVENASYGSVHFAFEGKARDFYKIYVKALLRPLAVLVPWFILMAVYFGFVSPLAGDPENLPPEQAAALGAIVIVTAVLIYGSFAYIWTYIITGVANLTWNGTRLQSHRFRCTLEAGKMLRLFVSNIVAIVFSVGLMVPWASVRLARYRIEQLALLREGSLDEFTAGPQQDVSATGEEVGDFFGFDFGL